MRKLLLLVVLLVVLGGAGLFLLNHPPRSFFPHAETFRCTRVSGGNAASITVAVSGDAAEVTVGTERAAAAASHGWNRLGARLPDGRSVDIRPDSGTGIYYNPPFATGEYRCARAAG